MNYEVSEVWSVKYEVWSMNYEHCCLVSLLILVPRSELSISCDLLGEGSSEKNCYCRRTSLSRTITHFELLILLCSKHLLCYVTASYERYNSLYWAHNRTLQPCYHEKHCFSLLNLLLSTSFNFYSYNFHKLTLFWLALLVEGWMVSGLHRIPGGSPVSIMFPFG